MILIELFKTTSQETCDMLRDGLLHSNNMNTWPNRLLTDIFEAFVEVYVVNHTLSASNRTQSNNVGSFYRVRKTWLSLSLYKNTRSIRVLFVN